MKKNFAANRNPALTPLLALSARVGSDPLLTQGSTGNASLKLNRFLWIKASGKWMADAAHEDILVPGDLTQVRKCVKQNVESADLYPNASIETAMHAELPHRVILHAHCVNTIAWAVRRDASAQLERLLCGLRWQWIPYVPSGLAMARTIQRVLSNSPQTY
jgi:rhamnose utilization protein RhaD (predicted bifunctional aldolase and dehydrogenase)